MTGPDELPRSRRRGRGRALVAVMIAVTVGVVVAVDRQERGKGELSAIQEVERDFRIPVVSIINFGQIIAYLEETGLHAEHLDAVRRYRDEFGVIV